MMTDEPECCNDGWGARFTCLMTIGSIKLVNARHVGGL